MKFYTKPYCPLCDEIREVLNELDACYEEIDITKLKPTEATFLEYRNEIPVLENKGDRWLYRENSVRNLKDWLLDQGMVSR